MKLDPGLVALFGSKTRLAVVAVLSNAFRPLTGYRIAKVADLAPIKVYAELRRLGAGGVVRQEEGGWVMADPSIRAVVAQRVRIRWDEDWDAQREGWAVETPSLLSAYLREIDQRVRADPSYLRPRGWKPPKAALRGMERLRRPPDKDVLLRRRGLRTSRREDWARGP